METQLLSYYILEASGVSLFILMKTMISISENPESFRCWTLELAALVSVVPRLVRRYVANSTNKVR